MIDVQKSSSSTLIFQDFYFTTLILISLHSHLTFTLTYDRLTKFAALHIFILGESHGFDLYCEHIAKGFGGDMEWINEPSRIIARDNEDDPAAPSQASTDHAMPISAFTVDTDNDIVMSSNTRK
ncbi:hypothetical protein N7519_007936 [Penicillium mononematosum]|uniref:uncharacterized protein n=1 Tax=Penicillium mononematosum TaxID=268346 RepID=UPI00254715E0|nr:uncharacterized protein N7519_007936 [Penicillium mononematosum]KAJ6186635.1 hypothetical protein N7519_007936 [Penicillium mononematosum]